MLSKLKVFFIDALCYTYSLAKLFNSVHGTLNPGSVFVAPLRIYIQIVKRSRDGQDEMKLFWRVENADLCMFLRILALSDLNGLIDRRAKVKNLISSRLNRPFYWSSFFLFLSSLNERISQSCVYVLKEESTLSSNIYIG